MSSLSQGALRLMRTYSRIVKGRVGYAEPTQLAEFSSVSAPGAVGVRLFECRGAFGCKVVGGRLAFTTAGAGSSVVVVRKHLAAHAAAPDAATSGANITLVASAAADGTVNTPVSFTLTAANADMELGDKLMVVTPATLAGLLVQIEYVYR